MDSEHSLKTVNIHKCDLLQGEALVAQSCPTLCNPMDCSPPSSPVHGNSSGKSTGVGSHSLLQGIFPTRGSNLGLLRCRQILYHLSQQGRPLQWKEQMQMSKGEVCWGQSPAGSRGGALAARPVERGQLGSPTLTATALGRAADGQTFYWGSVTFPRLSLISGRFGGGADNTRPRALNINDRIRPSSGWGPWGKRLLSGRTCWRPVVADGHGRPLCREGSLFASHFCVLEVTRLLGQLPKSESSSVGSEESTFMLYWTGCIPDMDLT